MLAGAAMIAACSAAAIGITSSASAATSTPYTCSGGAISSGSYASITVTGYCWAQENAVINVVHNVDLAPGAILDAQWAPATITVGHDVTVAAGALLGLGCQAPTFFTPNNTAHECSTDAAAIDENGPPPYPYTPTVDAYTTISVKGDITATDADTILLNGITVKGNVTLTGGGENVNPWPIKNNTIGHDLTVSGVSANWIGVLFNSVGHDADQ
jgi:hypothetical protein